MSEIELFVMLVAAHCYGDFILQPDTLARRKNEPPFLLLHVLIHGIMAYVVLQQWQLWQVPLLVIAVHAVIDFIKGRVAATPKTFAIDQAAHVATLYGIAWLVTALPIHTPADYQPRYFQELLIGGAGLAATIFGAKYFIDQVARQIMERNPDLELALKKGLEGGGAEIGKIERALIFALITIGQPAGIGFLIAAKSILRFEEAKRQIIAEYVLIGTLWSFGLAIVLSWLTLQAITILG